MNPAPSAASWRAVLLEETAGTPSYGLYASTDTGRPAVQMTIGGNSVMVVGPKALPQNQWSHLAATYDGTALHLYVNHAEVASQVATGTIAASSGTLQIGGSAVSGQYFAGVIDEVRVYNRALTQKAIQADQNTAIK